MTAADAAFRVPSEVVYTVAEHELDAGSGDERALSHVFDLLAVALDRGSIALARCACETGSAQLRGTALAYLESALPRTLFAKLERRMALLAPLRQ